MKKRFIGLGVLLGLIFSFLVSFAADDDISRLYTFTSGTTIQSSQVNGEFNQVVSTMNGKMSRAGVNTVSGNNTFSGTNTFSGINTFSHASSPIKTDFLLEYTAANGITVDGLKIRDSIAGSKRGMAGLVVAYSDATAVTVATGWATDSTGAEIIEVSSPLTLDFDTGVGTINGSQAAEASGTWYYAWLCKGASGVGGLLNTSSSSVTCPSGYNSYSRLLPIAIRNDGSSNIIPFYVGNGWPTRPYIGFAANTTDLGSPAGTLNVLSAGTATSFTDVTLSSFAPPISKLVRLHGLNVYTATNRTAFIRPNGSSINGYAIRAGSTFVVVAGDFDMETDASQIVEYKEEGAGSALTLDVLGFYVTEVAQ